ncbi:cytochrome c oxidase assembly protein subunit 17 [Acrasis kona]|uniref:Cytochrome c oxidase assembly protein subunit 17 n=1 Tax=Acrasis kona TaxID=1008807 RepID=A0AAW2Z497_9EUKA
MSTRDCEYTRSFLDQCIAEKKSSNDCKYQRWALDMCLGSTKKDDLVKSIEDELKQNPKTPAKKICCSCLDTKKARDACSMFNGPDSELCTYVIDAHKLCLKEEGFKI